MALFRGEPIEKITRKTFLALAQIADELQILDGSQQLRAELAIDEFMFTIDVFDKALRIQTLSTLARIKSHLRL